MSTPPGKSGGTGRNRLNSNGREGQRASSSRNKNQKKNPDRDNRQSAGAQSQDTKRDITPDNRSTSDNNSSQSAQQGSDQGRRPSSTQNQNRSLKGAMQDAGKNAARNLGQQSAEAAGFGEGTAQGDIGRGVVHGAKSVGNLARGNVVGAAHNAAKSVSKTVSGVKRGIEEAAEDPTSSNGQSSATGSSGGSQQENKKNTPLKVGAGSAGVAMGAAQSAPAIGQFLIAQAIKAVTTFLSNIVSFVSQLAVKLVTGAIHAVASVVGAVVGAIGSIGTAIVGVGVAVVTFLTGGAVGVHTNAVHEHNVRQEKLFDDICNRGSGSEGSDDDAAKKVPQTDMAKKRMESAKHIYYVMKSWGARDEVIAAILGNFDHESKMDPYAVETIFDEPFAYGPRKKRAHELEYNINLYNPSYAARETGVAAAKYAGIGLGQWTGPRNLSLQKYAKKHNLEVSDVDTQLGFLISPDEGSNGALVRAMINNKAPFDKMSMEDILAKFTWTWEVPNPEHADIASRTTSAKEFSAQFSSWGDPPEDIKKKAADIMSVAGASVEGGEAKSNEEKANRCRNFSDLNVSNDSAANAAVILSAANQSMVTGNDGTYWYMDVHDKIALDIGVIYHHYADCGHFVKTAVAWSGVDDKIAGQGNTVALDKYFRSSADWEVVHETLGDHVDDLKPGDILMYKHSDGSYQHINMFVGEKAVRDVREKLPEGMKGVKPHSVIAEASLDERGPGLRPFAPGYDTTATVYRYVGPKRKGRWTDYRPNSAHSMTDISTSFHHS